MYQKQELLHKTLVEILDFVVSICEEHNFTYFLAYGTALGAYRHSGFIPWDDDLDIMMPRKDYNAFIRIMHSIHSDRYTIQDETTEKNYFLTFAKIRKKGTVFIENITDGLYSDNGIYIDVFPLDNVSSQNKIFREFDNLYISYWRHVLKHNACEKLYRQKQSKIFFLLDSILCLPGIGKKNRKILADLNKHISRFESQDSEYVAQYDQCLEKAIMPRNVCFPPSVIEFEGKKYSAPHDIKEYLRIQYGDDYMTLPPVSKRQTHEPIKLEF
jgi:lipopolysaccharide cholinephosphotransferase